MSTVEYEIVDVFTDRPFAGNPLAVVFGAQALATGQLQALAREFNLSETVFVLPPSPAGPAGGGDGPPATYRARIFTPEQELPFAGHPSVGAAVTVTRRGLAGAGRLVQECGAGRLPIEVTVDGRGTLTGGAPTVGPPLDPEPLLSVVGLTTADFAGPVPRTAGCGLDFPYLSVRPEAVRTAAIDVALSRRLGVAQISVLAWDGDTRTAHVRVFCPGMAVPEDPATGSAALGLGVWLVAGGLLPGDGESSYTVRQGSELGRPAQLDCTVSAAGGTATGATVSGHVVPVARGEIAVPPFIG
jgi:trans-2,3-dihydro-3-hydroxyanthranilate isomerase